MSEIKPRNVVLLGATGSIGQSAIRVLRMHPERLRLIGVSAHSNHTGLAEICKEFNVPNAALTDSTAYRSGKDSLPSGTRLFSGESALIDLATLDKADIVLVAITGARALHPAIQAIESGKDIALANKELLVLGGSLVIAAAKKNKIRLLPVDSEHNAIFQCLQGYTTNQVEKLLLTASGGPFHRMPVEALETIRPEDATTHPNWSMGRKITVDSSTMANKGLELIEAHWLFGIEPERIEVVIHPQSIAHSFVQFKDGCIIGQFSPPSMTFSIQHCLLYPDRLPGVEPSIDFKKSLQLDFEAPDLQRYPCLDMAYQCLYRGGSATIIYNAANEVAVERFLNNEIRYLDIPKIIDQALSGLDIPIKHDTIEERLSIDAEIRSFCYGIKPAC